MFRLVLSICYFKSNTVLLSDGYITENPWQDWCSCSHPYHRQHPPWSAPEGSTLLWAGAMQTSWRAPSERTRCSPPTCQMELLLQSLLPVCWENDSCTFFPFTSDAFRQVRQTFCSICLVHFSSFFCPSLIKEGLQEILYCRTSHKRIEANLQEAGDAGAAKSPPTHGKLPVCTI